MTDQLYSIEEARARLGGIPCNGIYRLLRAGDLPSVVIGCRRFIAAAALGKFIASRTTTASPSKAATRATSPDQRGTLNLPLPITPAARRVVRRG